MILSDLFSGTQLKNTGAAQNQVSGAGNRAAVNKADQNALMNRQIQALKPGQTLQGEVISRDGGQAQIKVGDDLVLEAKIDQDMNLQVGKTMTFEVRNNGQNLTLSPLFANTATQENALKALDMAGLPANQTTVSMTGLMMNAGLSVDRNSLQQMFREINLFSGSNIADVIDLHKLGLAVNEENLNQISSYKNLTHQLVEGMHTVLNALPESIEGMVNDGNIDGAARMFQDLLEMIGELPAEEAAAQEGEALSEGLAKADAEGGLPAENVQTVVISDEEGTASESAALKGEFAAVMPDAADELLALSEEADGGAKAAQSVTHETDPSSGMNSATAKELLDLVQNTVGGKESYVALSEQLTKAFSEGTVADQAKALQQLLQQGIKDGDQKLLHGLLSNKGAQNLLEEGLSRLWTMEPKDVADQGKVEELYSRLDRQLNHLSRMLEENGQSGSKAFQAVNNMNQNIDFLQQLNQAYTYVQLPLHLQQGDAHGDLYVYTNKRNLAAKDGQISALLHLDMENLGPVDVYVAMQAEKVNTRFYVQDDSMLDFLNDHMDLLMARLQKRGYDCSFNMQVRDAGEEKNSGIKGLMAESHTKPIAQYAFDVRA